MTRDEFMATLDKVVAVFDPRGWTEDRAESYYRIFCNWSLEEWWDACDGAIAGLKYFPKPAELAELGGRTPGRRRAAEGTPKGLSSCPYCLGGRIWFEVRTQYSPNGSECHLACDCASGAEIIRRELRHFYPTPSHPIPPYT